MLGSDLHSVGSRDLRDEAGTVVLVGFDEVAATASAVLAGSGLSVVHVPAAGDALRALVDRRAEVVLADAKEGPELTRALRARPEHAATHIVVCAALGSPHEVRAAVDSGADDVLGIPFEPEVLVARVTAGFRAAQWRASEARLRSLVENIPGAVYRCACDADWTMQWISDEIGTISGFPASDFVDSSVRSFASVIHPDDREQVERNVTEAVDAARPFSLEYRICRADGETRWVLERGQAQDAADGKRWLDGAIFDITARRAAEEALRGRQVAEAQLGEVRASRARLVDAADRARRDIERNLHDGAQQRFVSVALRLRVWLASHDLPGGDGDELAEVLDELKTGLAELGDLARGLHPAILSDRGLEYALRALTRRAPVPVEVRIVLPEKRLPMPVETAAYFTVSEALTNVAKYARAQRAWVVAEHGDGQLRLEVGDDGVGGADAATGLQGLRDRVATVGGTLRVDSAAGAGTVLQARLPIPGDEMP